MSAQKRSKRPMKAYSTKAVAVVLAGTMVFGGASAVFADKAVTTVAPATAAAAATKATVGIFSDVKTGLWAEKHIYKLASQGIVVGNNGLFRPGDPVTQQEAVLMALRFMKLQDQVVSNSTAVLPTDLKVTNYYKNYVVLAFQKGLLDKASEMAPDNLKTSWGERKASREWIAELLIRALGKSADAAAVASEPTGFADDAKVSASKRGYINTAVDLGLANGLDGNRFDPLGAVTRAQLATFLSRAEAHNTIEYDNTVSGSISQLKDGKLSIYNNGKTTVFNLGADTAYFTSTSESRINLSDIKPYTKVTVIGANNNAVYVELIDATQQVESLTGSVAMIAPNHKIFLKTATGFPEYYYDDTTTFVDVNGASVDPTSLVAGSVVSLLLETYSGSHKIVYVQVTSGVVNKTATGTIQSLDLSDKSISFKNDSGAVETFKWEDGTSLFSSQSTILTPADLKPNSVVKYTIKDNIIRSVEVTSGLERVIKGSIYEITGSSIVYKKADGTREVKLLGTKPSIIIPNLANPVMGDLIADPVGGDTIQLTLNSSDQVTKIEVLSRQIDQIIGATVVDYNSKTQLLTVLDHNKKAYAVQLDDKTKLAYDGMPATSIKDMGYRLTENRKVDFVALGQRALSVEITTKYVGTLTSVNTTSKTMVLKLSNGQNMILAYPAVIDFFARNATITDVPLNSVVTAELGVAQDVISVLRVNSYQQFEVASVNDAMNKLNLKSSSGNNEINTLSIPLTNEVGQAIKLSEINAGDYVNVSLHGSSPLSIQSVKETIGQILTLDATSGTLVVKDYAGIAQTLNVSSGVKIVRDGVTTTAISGIAVTDRVVARKDIDGSTIIRVLPQLSRTYSRYESGSNSIVTKRENLTENYRFVLDSKVYIHQGDTTLSVQSLKENDNIIVYFNNNNVIEIVKQ